MATRKPKILFIMYDGLTDPLGQSQVLSYLKPLSEIYSFDVIGFEKEDKYLEQKKQISESINNLDIRWLPIKYHKKPQILSTIYDFYLGWKKAKEYGEINKYDLIHCRSSSIGNVALLLKKRYKAKLIFDMRGWWADEKKESGAWNSILFRPIYYYFKRLETKLFKISDHTISLTKAGYDEILNQKLKNAEDISIIPTCVNFEVFHSFNNEIRFQIRKELNISIDDTVILYSGSIGGNYSLELIIKIYQTLISLNKKTKILLLTQTDKNIVEKEANKFKVDMDDVIIKSCNYSDVYRYLMAGDIGTINYRKSFSVIGRSPTKMGEYWACGLPVISETDIGDVDHLITKYKKSGFLVNLKKTESIKTALLELLSSNNNQSKLRQYALDYFDLSKGVKSYGEVYKKVLKNKTI